MTLVPLKVLKRQPQTVEEIAEAKKSHAELTGKVAEMETVCEEAERKNRTLASWTKERVDRLSQVKGMWENFRSLIDNHEAIVSKQVRFRIRSSKSICIMGKGVASEKKNIYILVTLFTYLRAIRVLSNV